MTKPRSISGMPPNRGRKCPPIGAILMLAVLAMPYARAHGGHYTLAFQRKQPAWENADSSNVGGNCGGAACRVWVWDEAGQPVSGVTLMTSWGVVLGETDTDGRAQFNTTAAYHNYDVLCADNNGSTSDLTLLMVKNLLHCPGLHSYEVGFLYKSKVSNPGTFDLGLYGDWPEPETDFWQAPYTRSLAFNGVEADDYWSDASYLGNWQNPPSYFGQTFIATGDRVVAARVHGSRPDNGLLDWQMRVVSFPDLTPIGPVTSVPVRYPFGWEAFWGVNDVRVVPGKKYMLQIWRNNGGLNIWHVGTDVYPQGEYYEGTTAFPQYDLNGHVCCMTVGDGGSAVVSTGMVAWYPLDEGTAFVAHDGSGREHTGYVKNANPFVWVDGRFGKAINLDGYDDYITVMDYKGIIGAQPRTCAAWIKTGTPGRSIIAWGEYTQASRWALRTDDQGRLRIEIGGGNAVGTRNVADNAWHHVAVVSDGTTCDNAAFYVDGRVDPHTSGSALPINTVWGANVTIGAAPDYTRYFQGLLDEVAVFDLALTETQVRQLCTTSAATFLNPCGDAMLQEVFRRPADINKDCIVDLRDASILAGDWLRSGLLAADVLFDETVDFADASLLADDYLLSITPGLVLHLPFDESAGALASDKSVNAFAAALTNMDDSAWVAGRTGGALIFDGVNDSVVVGGYKGIDGGRSRTVCAWIKAEAGGVIVSWGSGDASSARWVMRADSNGSLRLQAGGASCVGTAVVCDNEWHHLAIVLKDDGSADLAEVKFYVDGVRDVLSIASSLPINTLVDSPASQDVTIGSFVPTASFFHGVIDEVRIYSLALTARQIAEVAQ